METSADLPMRPKCLRCREMELVQSSDSQTEVEFFGCPACHRRYSKPVGGSLSYRWPNPIGIALYGFLFRSGSEAVHLAMAMQALAEDASVEQVALALCEIELELQDPTQELSSMLPGSGRSEVECRAFLCSVVEQLRGWLNANA